MSYFNLTLTEALDTSNLESIDGVSGIPITIEQAKALFDKELAGKWDRRNPQSSVMVKSIGKNFSEFLSFLLTMTWEANLKSLAYLGELKFYEEW